MPKYNLDALGPQEFERLCQSLVQQIIGPGAKIYGMGKDGAREATFQGKAKYPSEKEQWDGSWIFQAKFHDTMQLGPVKARELLINDIDEELKIITEKYKYPCDNYILLTNVTLTPAFQSGTKDYLDKNIIPKYKKRIKNIHVWAADEICRFLDAYPGIKKTYSSLLVPGDIIASLLGLLEERKTGFDDLIKLYCQGCFEHERHALLDDAGDVEDERISLPRVFIDLDVNPPEISDKHRLDLEPLPEWLKQAISNPKRESALSYLFDDSIPGMVIIGGPGQGKSTLGQYISQVYRARLMGRLTEIVEDAAQMEKCVPRIPFRIILRDYAQWLTKEKEPNSISAYIATLVTRESDRTTSSEQIHEILKSNPSILVLDGLDEVSDKKLRTRILDNITIFVNQVREVLKGDLRIVATTRPYGYSEEFDPKRYLHLTLQKLSENKANLYAKRWSSAREPVPKDRERIQNAFNTCLRDKVVSVLTATPLQVTILLVIIRARGTPPKQREHLFSSYMDIIYQREQKHRPELLRTEQNLIYGLHKYLGYLLHKRAEHDETAATMNQKEFNITVSEYLNYCDPTLTDQELQEKTGQIISEASQRLVLIESPREGYYGFGLTSIREFFAAAYLVDTAKDTKEREERFKAIARLSHWRNVVLFFVGRVGRRLTGEAPGLIDVCREIDTEGADRFLKRGAELVSQIVDDRALQVAHYEIGAIQYALSQLGGGYIDDPDLGKFLQPFILLPGKYSERIVRPWLEEKLKTIAAENLHLYVQAYRRLFGSKESLHSALERMSTTNSPIVQVWALCQAIDIELLKTWVPDLVDKVVEVLSIEEVAKKISSHWSKIVSILKCQLTSKAQLAIAISPLYEDRYKVGNVFNFSETLKKELKRIEPHSEFRKNLLLTWGFSLLLKLEIEPWKRNFTYEDVSVTWPNVISPSFKDQFKENTDLIKEFCNTFSHEKEPRIRLTAATFQYLMAPDDIAKYTNLAKLLEEFSSANFPYKNFLKISGFPVYFFQQKEKLQESFNDLGILLKFYKSQEEYEADMTELNKLINETSQSISHHPHKLIHWLIRKNKSFWEKYLDSSIIQKLKKWLSQRCFSEGLLYRCIYRRNFTSDIGLVELSLSLAEACLSNNKNPLIDGDFEYASFFNWQESSDQESSQIKVRLKAVLDEVLEMKDPYSKIELYQFKCLYWASLNASILDKEYMKRMSTTFGNIHDFQSSYWYARYANHTQSNLFELLQSEDTAISRISAVTLSVITNTMKSKRREYKKFQSKGKEFKEFFIEEYGVGEKLWELAQNKDDPWRNKYIMGMASCKLNWNQHSDTWFEELKCQSNDGEIRAWIEVLLNGSPRTSYDCNALFNFLIRILENPENIDYKIRSAAISRLRKLVTEMEPSGFDESPLNLPLPRKLPFNWQ